VPIHANQDIEWTNRSRPDLKTDSGQLVGSARGWAKGEHTSDRAQKLMRSSPVAVQCVPNSAGPQTEALDDQSNRARLLQQTMVMNSGFRSPTTATQPIGTPQGKMEPCAN